MPCWIPHIFCISILWCHVLCLWSSCSERRRDWMIQKHWWQCCSDVTFQFHLKVRMIRANSKWLTVRQGWQKKLEISVKDLPKVATSENYLSNVAAPQVAKFGKWVQAAECLKGSCPADKEGEDLYSDLVFCCLFWVLLRSKSKWKYWHSVAQPVLWLFAPWQCHCLVIWCNKKETK